MVGLRLNWVITFVLLACALTMIGVMATRATFAIDATSTFHIKSCIDTAEYKNKNGNWVSLKRGDLLQYLGLNYAGSGSGGTKSGDWCVNSGKQNNAENPHIIYVVDGVNPAMDYTGNLELRFYFHSEISWWSGASWGAVDYRTGFSTGSHSVKNNDAVIFCTSGNCGGYAGVYITKSRTVGAVTVQGNGQGTSYTTAQKNKSVSTNTSGDVTYQGTVNFKTSAEKWTNNYVGIFRCDESGTNCGNSRELEDYNAVSTNANISVWYFSKRTLTVKAIDTAGNSVPGVSDRTVAVRWGDTKVYSIDGQSVKYDKSPASITRKTVDGYEFKGWSASVADAKSGKYENKDSKYVVNDLANNKTIYVVYEKKSFSGEARVSSGDKYSTSNSPNAKTGWDGSKVNITVQCSSSSTCKAAWELAIKQNSDTTVATPYAVYRKIDDGEYVLLSSGSSTGKNSSASYKVQNLGHSITNQTVCYRMYYSKDGTGTAEKGGYVQACATGVLPQKTLTAVAVDKDGKEIPNVATWTTNSKGAETGVVDSGGNAYITRKKTISGWKFTGCFATSKTNAKNRSCVTTTEKSNVRYLNASGINYHVNPLTKNEKVYLVYEKQDDKLTLTAYAVTDGGSLLNGGDPIDEKTVEKNASASVTHTKFSQEKYEFCGWNTSQTGGCSDNKSSNYTIDKMEDDVAVYAVYKKTGDGPDDGPGDDPTPGGGGDCAEWTPGSYNPVAAPEWITGTESGTTSTVSKVKNNNVSKYSTWMDLVYAKPTDNVSWIHCDFPGAQRMANVQVTTNHNNNEKYHSCDSWWETSCSSYDSYTLTYNKMSSVDSWSNNYRVTASNFAANSYSGSGSASYGDTAIMEDTNDHAVVVAETGRTLRETMKTGTPSTASATLAETGPVTWSCDWRSDGYEEVFDSGDTCTGGWETVTLENGTKTSQCKEWTHWEDKRLHHSWHDTCQHDGNYISHSSSGTANSHADVIVPYNFDNTTKITTEQQTDKDRIVYAGETASVDFEVYTTARENNTTEGTYATRVDEAKWRLEVCYEDVNGGSACVETTPAAAGSSGVLNSTGADESTWEKKGASFNVPDITAGSRVCVRSVIYPQNSGAETNTDPKGNDTWEYSPEDNRICFTVAKRPNFQVWGGSVYSAKNLDVRDQVSLKDRNAFNTNPSGYSFNPNSGTAKYVFGPWTEISLVANGAVRGLASGAGAGYTLNNSGNLIASPGGSAENGSSGEYCKRSTLSFANVNCNTSVGNIGGARRIANVNVNRDQLVASMAANTGLTGESVNYINESGDATISNITLGHNTNQLLKAGGDITINGNIIYQDSYATIGEMPKYIIYAKGDIRIDCRVSRIDAVLIADGNINTCVDGDNDNPDVNDSVRSNRLIINGSLIADTLTLGRTYGAGVGYNSIVPAEIINYDTSLYLWAYDGAKVNASGETSVVYQREVAPRL